MHPSQTRETAFNKDEEKHGQREILESRDIRQVPDKRRVEVQSQNRDLLIRDVFTCLACPKNFPRSLTTLKIHVDVIRISYERSHEHPQKATRPARECRTPLTLLMD